MKGKTYKSVNALMADTDKRWAAEQAVVRAAKRWKFERDAWLARMEPVSVVPLAAWEAAKRLEAAVTDDDDGQQIRAAIAAIKNGRQP